jgi:hypothetical protein
MDLSRATDEDLRAELDGAQKFLSALMSGAPLGRSYEGREEAKKAELHQGIAAIQSELDKRDASRPLKDAAIQKPGPV